MLKDVIAFVKSRSGETDRDTILREINFAWNEIWTADDLPNSLFEITVEPLDNLARISLPWFVGTIRGVKQGFGRTRIHLNTPRPYYQDAEYGQSPWTWRILGSNSLKTTITNATTLTLTIDQAEASAFSVTLIGPTDLAQEHREVITFAAGEVSKETSARFTDCSISKSRITLVNVDIKDSLGNVLGFIPNNAFKANNTVIQIVDKCFTPCNTCMCFDILYKLATPYLSFDETPVPFKEVLMAKTLEWMSLPKENGQQTAMLFSEKAKTLLGQGNNNNNSVEKRVDLGLSLFETQYQGSL